MPACALMKDTSMDTNSTPRHQTTRLRQEPKRRLLTVTAIEDITPHMRRITFTSPDLADFVSPAPDDHIKLFLPNPAVPSGESMRDYTPRRFDAERLSLTIDFARHEAGPATRWAEAAQVGDQLAIGGPKGSGIVADDFDYYLLLGDEAALPSIARRIEGLRAGVPVTSVVVVESEADVQAVTTAARHDAIWVFRAGRDADDATLLREALARWQAPAGEGYVWIAAEAQVARTLKAYMLDERAHPKAWLKAAGYWVRGEAGAHAKLEG